jgi:pimeloyl-ACP methyl ester carboxylesterase
MGQEVRFCQVPGGRVACATVGDGPPLVLAPWWISHIELDWERPDFRAFVEALAWDRTVLRYDPLGTGLSDHTEAEHRGLDAELVTVEAVLDGMDLPRAALLGISSGACLAAALAARSPERVEALVLLGATRREPGSRPPRCATPSSRPFPRTGASAPACWRMSSFPRPRRRSSGLSRTAGAAPRRASDRAASLPAARGRTLGYSDGMPLMS